MTEIHKLVPEVLRKAELSDIADVEKWGKAWKSLLG